jgi:hypothetical protein
MGVISGSQKPGASVRYSVILSGIKPPMEHFRLEMSNLGVSAVVINHIIEKVPLILKTGMSLDKAKKYAGAIQRAGGMVKIIGHGSTETKNSATDIVDIEPMENFTMCRQCGHKQVKKDICIKCGFSLS